MALGAGVAVALGAGVAVAVALGAGLAVAPWVICGAKQGEVSGGEGDVSCGARGDWLDRSGYLKH